MNFFEENENGGVRKGPTNFSHIWNIIEKTTFIFQNLRVKMGRVSTVYHFVMSILRLEFNSVVSDPSRHEVLIIYSAKRFFFLLFSLDNLD